MVFKTILTGGVLSVLAGSIVYFGTAGADVRVDKDDAEARIEETELAGAADVAVTSEDSVLASAKVETVSDVDVVAGETVIKTAEKLSVAAEQDPPNEKSKPKTKWLDQYLKKTKPGAKSDKDDKDAMHDAEADAMDAKSEMMDAEADAMDAKSEMMDAEADAMDAKADMMDSEAETMDAKAEMMDAEADAMQAKADMMEAEANMMEEEADAMKAELMGDDAEHMGQRHADWKKRRRIRIKKRMSGADADATASGSYVISKDSRSETQDLEPLESGSIDLDALDLDGDIDPEMLKEQLGLEDEKNVEIHIVKKMDRKSSHVKQAMNEIPAIDYDAVLAEAKKLLVVDMKNQAVLEIVDFAVDNRDMTEAADLVQELSTPELRDTARARIGAGLARCGKAEAAFAVIDELEIDELAAPIRLEIITALMATRQERRAAGVRN